MHLQNICQSQTLNVDQAMIIYKEILIEMAFILLPIMLVAVVAGLLEIFFNLDCFLQQNHLNLI